MEEKRYVFGWIPFTMVFYSVVIMLVIGVGSLGYLGYTKFIAKEQANAETQVIREKVGNVDSKSQRLIDLMGQYNKLETEIVDLKNDPTRTDSVKARRDQQVSLVESMCQVKVTMPDDRVPTDAQRFFTQHPCGR